MPTWVTTLAAVSIAFSVLSAGWIVLDETRRPQPMRIMNVVWPTTALYGGLFGLWMYHRIGRAPTRGSESHPHHSKPKSRASYQTKPDASSVAVGTTHCGAGCTLGDLSAEVLLLLAPGLAVTLGWHTLWNEPIYSTWTLDFILAFGLGIAFQYGSIKPMHPELGRLASLKRALQADALSLIAWQMGMYGIMAFAHFVAFPRFLHTDLPAASLPFWWVMQFAMLGGFLTAFPVNWWLIGTGIKESM